jgi:hypothetical protein
MVMQGGFWTYKEDEIVCQAPHYQTLQEAGDISRDSSSVSEDPERHHWQAGDSPFNVYEDGIKQ